MAPPRPVNPANWEKNPGGLGEVVSLGDASQFINGRAYALHEWESSEYPSLDLLKSDWEEMNFYSNLQLPERQYCDFGDLLFMWSANIWTRNMERKHALFIIITFGKLNVRKWQ